MELTNEQREKARAMLINLVAFCTLMENGNGILGKSPDYVMEKFQRYVGKSDDSWKWGLDNNNQSKVRQWIERWAKPTHNGN